DVSIYIYSVVSALVLVIVFFFFFQAEDGIRDATVTGVQTCALPISSGLRASTNPLSCAQTTQAIPRVDEIGQTPVGILPGIQEGGIGPDGSEGIAFRLVQLAQPVVGQQPILLGLPTKFGAAHRLLVSAHRVIQAAQLSKPLRQGFPCVVRGVQRKR